MFVWVIQDFQKQFILQQKELRWLSLVDYPLVSLPPIPYNCHFFTLTQFLENKIYTEKRQFLR